MTNTFQTKIGIIQVANYTEGIEINVFLHTSMSFG